MKQYQSIGTFDSLCDVIKQRHRKPTEEQQQKDENQDGPEGAEEEEEEAFNVNTSHAESFKRGATYQVRRSEVTHVWCLWNHLNT